MAILAMSLPKSNLFTNLPTTPPPTPNATSTSLPQPPISIPKYPKRNPNSSKPQKKPGPPFKTHHNNSKYHKPVKPGQVITDDGDRSVIVKDSGVSYRLPGAPFDFQFSYSETPKAKPLAIREPAFLPFAPPTMPRPWTGKAPMKKSKRNIKLFEPLNPQMENDDDGGKRYEMLRAYELGMLEEKPKKKVLGAPLTKEEIRALLKHCIASNRQVNIDTVKVIEHKVVKKEESENASQSTTRMDGDCNSVSRDGETDGIQINGVNKARAFKFSELVAATENFKAAYFLGEGGFGKVYKGHLADTGQVVAIKQLNPDGCQGNREFIVEVLTLSMADHPNLVKLIGYCVEGHHRVLVYEYMPLGSLEDHLHDPWTDKKRLDWNTRMKIAAGAARGLEYLHDKMKPPVIYRDLKGSNILLGEGYHSKLSDFGLAKVGPLGDKTHVSTRVMGTYGYCAPDYAMTGQLTFKSDIYSFGVVLLEIITGRKAIDNTKSGAEQNLVAWARPLFKDRKKFHQMADPVLEGHYPVRGLYQALAIAAMCVQEQPNMRPLIADIVTALNYLASQKYDPEAQPPQGPRKNSSRKSRSIDDQKNPINVGGHDRTNSE